MQASFAERLKREYGAGFDPEISLDKAPEAGAPTDELVRRLKAHSLDRSRYILQGEIARGGMGAILRVWDEDLRRHLAMKVILGRGEAPSEGGTPAVEPQQLVRFLEEAQVTGQLDHPGIVPVHELGLAGDGRVFFTMKLVKGRDLQHVFDLVFEEKEGWNETRALSVVLKACEAMAYAHKKGVIHRDLKPSNVMVGDFGEVYVMDWGLARVLGSKDSHDIRLAPASGSEPRLVETDVRAGRVDAAGVPLLTMDGDVMGTPAYMAPEQARGEIEKLGPRSDVYSMGAMLYHLLARRPAYFTPHVRANNHAVLQMVLAAPPAPLSRLRRDLPPELTAICEKAMARDASQRYADTLALAEDLRAFLEHRVVGAYETGAWAEARKWVQRNKPLAASLASGVFLLVVGLTALLAANTTIQAKNTELGTKNTALDLATKAAQASERTAREQEAQAKREKANVLKLSAFQTLDDLTKEADSPDMWPADPGLVERYRSWMTRAEELVSRLPEFRASLAEIEERALPQTEEERAQELEQARASDPGAPEPVKRVTWRFAKDGGGAETDDRWWHVQMVKLIGALEFFEDPNLGLMRGVSEAHSWGVAKRLGFAAAVETRTFGNDEARKSWSEAAAAIASSPKYGGLQLRPQLGLLPIGMDQDSGLWEFAHLQTGEPPVRGADGRLVLTEAMGLVFVLIPGGSSWMGSQNTDASGAYFDEHGNRDESPLHKVDLLPFLLSKYEMTQGQWERFTGQNPSLYRKDNYGITFNGADKPWSALHPVEQESWTRCVEVLGRLGCDLPTENQWEYAARAHTTTAYWSGDGAETLQGVGNVADAFARNHGGGMWSVIHAAWDDGQLVHAEVGSFRANAYGLHDVHGNVWEYCRDDYNIYSMGVSVGQGAQRSGSLCVIRGGSFMNAAVDARSACRSGFTRERALCTLGLRPAKCLAP